MNKSTSYTKYLAEELKNRGIQLELEHYDGYKSVDIFIPSVKLDIEIDGNQHIYDSNQALSDLKRTKYSLREGRITVRIANTAIYQNISGVADEILDIIKDLKSKTEIDKIKLIKKEEYKKIENKTKKKRIQEGAKRKYKTKKREVKKKKKNWKKYFFIGVIILFIIIVGYFILNEENQVEQTKNDPKDNNINPIPEQPKIKIEPIIVTGSKTDVIIKNNQQKPISLNVTYRIYSHWFGTDSTESKIFEINTGEKKSFKVYNNDGCNTAPCSVSILNFKEV